MSESLRSYCLRESLDWLLAEWDAAKNAPLTPDGVSYGSSRKIWWRCAKGHEWQAAPDNRRHGQKCPVCTGKKADAGVDDLLTLFPVIAAEWHTHKNNALTPADVRPGSKRLVWWQCEYGHEWTASPKSRMSGAGCPICAAEKSQEITFAAAFPQAAAQWHPTKNEPLTPNEIPINSTRRVWWRCEKGHEWRSEISERTRRRSGCPVCSGRKLDRGVNDLASLYPALAAEWAEENGSLRPSDVAANSSKRVYWKCGEGHIWRSTVSARSEEGKTCPVCRKNGDIGCRTRVDELLYPVERAVV